MEDLQSFIAVLEHSNNNLWGFHLPVPEITARVFMESGAKRVVCTLNGKTQFQCALIAKGDGAYCIMVNKKLRDSLGLKPGSSVQVTLRKDESKYGLPMPDEMGELLRQDDEGNQLFHALTPGKQRTLLYIAGSVKDPEKRLVRAMAIVEHLKAHEGKVNYRQLNEDLKNNRF